MLDNFKRVRFIVLKENQRILFIEIFEKVASFFDLHFRWKKILIVFWFQMYYLFTVGKFIERSAAKLKTNWRKAKKL